MNCHPECFWQCDDPRCLAECKNVYEQPVCRCQNTQYTPNCRVECAPNQCEMGSCPACQVLCEPNPLCGNIQCEELVANWACRKPRNCPYPKCELMCEQPSCEYTGTKNPWKTDYFSWPWILLWILLLVIFVNLKKK